MVPAYAKCAMAPESMNMTVLNAAVALGKKNALNVMELGKKVQMKCPDKLAESLSGIFITHQ
ncbi:MAG: hypothetical protein DYH15_12140 [Nitrosomonas sp. PRO4]|nr:hypothetical protein [Nitrosomonas sp. PRO4]